jgi:hypothetical protein
MMRSVHQYHEHAFYGLGHTMKVKRHTTNSIQLLPIQAESAFVTTTMCDLRHDNENYLENPNCFCNTRHRRPSNLNSTLSFSLFASLMLNTWVLDHDIKEMWRCTDKMDLRGFGQQNTAETCATDWARRSHGSVDGKMAEDFVRGRFWGRI